MISTDSLIKRIKENDPSLTEIYIDMLYYLCNFGQMDDKQFEEFSAALVQNTSIKTVEATKLFTLPSSTKRDGDVAKKPGFLGDFCSNTVTKPCEIFSDENCDRLGFKHFDLKEGEFLHLLTALLLNRREFNLSFYFCSFDKVPVNMLDRFFTALNFNPSCYKQIIFDSQNLEKFTPDAFAYFAKFLSMTKAHHLQLCSSNFHEMSLDSLKLFREALCKTKIKSLRFVLPNINKMTKEQVHILADAIALNTSLEYLDLNIRYCGDYSSETCNPEYCQIIASGIERNKSIKSLSLPYCIRIPTESFKFFADAINKNRSLTSLEVGNTFNSSDISNLKMLNEAIIGTNIKKIIFNYNFVFLKTLLCDSKSSDPLQKMLADTTKKTVNEIDVDQICLLQKLIYDENPLSFGLKHSIDKVMKRASWVDGIRIDMSEFIDNLEFIQLLAGLLLNKSNLSLYYFFLDRNIPFWRIDTLFSLLEKSPVCHEVMIVFGDQELDLNYFRRFLKFIENAKVQHIILRSFRGKDIPIKEFQDFMTSLKQLIISTNRSINFVYEQLDAEQTRLLSDVINFKLSPEKTKEVAAEISSPLRFSATESETNGTRNLLPTEELTSRESRLVVKRFI